MTFTPKDWKDSPDTTTPITAAALEDLEDRVTEGRYESVLWHGAAGNGVANDTTAIHAARDSAGVGGTVALPAGTYLVDGLTASVVNQTWVLDRGATIKHKNSAGAYSAAFTASAAGVTITGGKIDGNKANNANTYGMRLLASGGRATDMEIVDADIMAVDIYGAISDILVERCRIANAGASAVYIETGPSNVTVRDCYITDSNQGATTGHSGIGTYQDVTDVKILNNRIYDAVKTGIHIAGTPLAVRLLIEGNTIDTTTGADSTEGIAVTGEGIQVLGNTVRNTYVTGIIAWCSDSTRDILIANNEICDISQDAGDTHSGIIVYGVSGTSKGISVLNNHVYDTQGSPTTDRICRVEDAGGTLESVAVMGNTGRNCASTDGVVVDPAFRAVTRVSDNHFRSTVADVASTAAVTLPAAGDFFTVTGTAAITSIVADYADRRVTLKFSGTAAAAGLTDGSNLKLSANLAYTPDDTITLVCDGTNWYEVGRSVN